MYNFEILTFAEAPKPIEQKSRQGYTTFGVDNDYPNYLIDLFNGSPKHGAITQGKANYVNGREWVAEDETDLNARAFIAKCNKYEDLFSVTSKCVLDLIIFGGFYLQCDWSVMGNKVLVSHVDYTKVRTNKDNTQFWVKDSWNDFLNKDKAKEFLAFNVNNPKGTQILYVKKYRPNLFSYAIPEYVSAINYIQSDVEISKHILGNAQSGFNASKQISFTNGEPDTEDAKKKIERKFKEKFTGANGNKVVIEFVKDKDRKTIIEDLGQSDLTKEDFTAVNNLIQQEIFSGHKITSPMLFGIKTEGQLGGRSEIVEAYEIFTNTYVQEHQQFVEKIFNGLARINGAKSKITIQKLEPIQIDYFQPQLISLLPKEFIYEKLGIDPSKYNVITDSNPSTQGLSTNDNIKNLTGRQHQNIDRIVRKMQQGKLSKEQATMLLKSGYGLTDEEATQMLNPSQQFSDEDLISIFSEFGESADDYIEVSRKELFSDSLEEELARIDFEDDFTNNEAKALGLIDKDKLIDSEAIAKALKIEVSEADAIIKSLLDKGAIKQTTNNIGSVVTELTSPLMDLLDKKPTTTNFRVMYAYDWRSEVPSSERNTPAHPSREFCVKMMSLNKLWGRTDIEKISARLGYSVFDRVGGWWNDNGDIKYHCRHTWGARMVVKKSNNGK